MLFSLLAIYYSSRWMNSKFQRKVLLKSWVYLACFWELCPNDALTHWNKLCRRWFSSKYKLTVQIFPTKLENYFTIFFFFSWDIFATPAYSPWLWEDLNDMQTLTICIYVKRFSWQSTYYLVPSYISGRIFIVTSQYTNFQKFLWMAVCFIRQCTCLLLFLHYLDVRKWCCGGSAIYIAGRQNWITMPKTQF